MLLQVSSELGKYTQVLRGNSGTAPRGPAEERKRTEARGMLWNVGFYSNSYADYTEERTRTHTQCMHTYIHAYIL